MVGSQSVCLHKSIILNDLNVVTSYCIELQTLLSFCKIIDTINLRSFRVLAKNGSAIGVCIDTYVIYQSVLGKKTYESLICDS